MQLSSREDFHDCWVVQTSLQVADSNNRSARIFVAIVLVYEMTKLIVVQEFNKLSKNILFFVHSHKPFSGSKVRFEIVAHQKVSINDKISIISKNYLSAFMGQLWWIINIEWIADLKLRPKIWCFFEIFIKFAIGKDSHRPVELIQTKTICQQIGMALLRRLSHMATNNYGSVISIWAWLDNHKNKLT